MKIYQNYINGVFIDNKETLDIQNPGTGKTFAQHGLADVETVNEAVQSANRVLLKVALKIYVLLKEAEWSEQWGTIF